jgi:hypothetical protein
MKRYQECNPIVRLWRRRWYLLIPLTAARWYMQSPRADLVESWTLGVATAHIRMKWYYTIEEAFARQSA